MSDLDILATEQPKAIKLADGKDYTFPPMNLATWAAIEGALDFPLKQLQERFVSAPLQTLLDLTYALLKVNYPEMTKGEVGKLVTLDIVPSLTATFGRVFAQLITIAG